MGKKKRAAEDAVQTINAILIMRKKAVEPVLSEVLATYLENETGKPVSSEVKRAIDRRNVKYLNWILNGVPSER